MCLIEKKHKIDKAQEWSVKYDEMIYVAQNAAGVALRALNSTPFSETETDRQVCLMIHCQ